VQGGQGARMLPYPHDHSHGNLGVSCVHLNIDQRRHDLHVVLDTVMGGLNGSLQARIERFYLQQMAQTLLLLDPQRFKGPQKILVLALHLGERVLRSPLHQRVRNVREIIAVDDRKEARTQFAESDHRSSGSRTFDVKAVHQLRDAPQRAASSGRQNGFRIQKSPGIGDAGAFVFYQHLQALVPAKGQVELDFPAARVLNRVAGDLRDSRGDARLILGFEP